MCYQLDTSVVIIFIVHYLIWILTVLSCLKNTEFDIVLPEFFPTFKTTIFIFAVKDDNTPEGRYKSTAPTSVKVIVI